MATSQIVVMLMLLPLLLVLLMSCVILLFAHPLGKFIGPFPRLRQLNIVELGSFHFHLLSQPRACALHVRDRSAPLGHQYKLEGAFEPDIEFKSLRSQML